MTTISTESVLYRCGCTITPAFSSPLSEALIDWNETSNKLSLQSFSGQHPHSNMIVPSEFRINQIILESNVTGFTYVKIKLSLGPRYVYKYMTLLDSSISFVVGHLLLGRQAFLAGKPDAKTPVFISMLPNIDVKILYKCA